MKFEFDNTLQVKQFAQTKEARQLLSVPVGSEKQLFKVGDKVTSTEYSCIRLTGLDVTITEVEKVNGYYRYNVKWNRIKSGCKKKVETVYDNFRQKDLRLV